MGVNINVEDLLEHLKPACVVITVGHSACVIGSSISHTIREHVQETENTR